MSYKNAKGVFPSQPGDEPAEITIRRLRDGGPFWIFVDQWLPPPSTYVKVTDGKLIAEGCIRAVTKEWSVMFNYKFGDVIAWLSEPSIPPPPTRAEYEQYKAQMKEEIDA